MQLSITRQQTSDEGTQGRAELGGAVWASLELPWRENHTAYSCIPAGTYSAALLFSPRFGCQLYHLLAVPERSQILIHSGNFAGDVTRGLKTDVTGCILIGHSYGHLSITGPTGQFAVLSSHMALSEFMAVTRGEPLDVAISWADGVSPE